jgi:hypothetical protein
MRDKLNRLLVNLLRIGWHAKAVEAADLSGQGIRQDYGYLATLNRRGAIFKDGFDVHPIFFAVNLDTASDPIFEHKGVALRWIQLVPPFDPPLIIFDICLCCEFFWLIVD